jgi:hypothetical protein
MLRAFTQIVGRAVTYPAIAFWFAFLGAPSGSLAALFYRILNQDRNAFAFPTPMQLFDDPQCLFLLKVGCTISMIAMGFVGRRTHVVFRHLACRRRCKHYFILANDLIVTFCLTGLGMVAFLPFLKTGEPTLS